MKRTLSILTAAIFASAIAMPAFAQSTMQASPSAEASPAASGKTMKKHHHGHKKKGSMASPEASPSPSN